MAVSPARRRRARAGAGGGRSCPPLHCAAAAGHCDVICASAASGACVHRAAVRQGRLVRRPRTGETWESVGAAVPVLQAASDGTVWRLQLVEKLYM